MNKIQKLGYSLASFGSNLAYQAFSTYLIFFYVDIMKLAPLLVTAGMTIYGLWNAFNDPIFGYLSDRTQTRWGRRKPFIVLGFLPLAVTFAFLWLPQFFHLSSAGLFFYFLATILLFDTFYTLVVINWTAYFPEIFPKLAERAEVNSYRQALSILGLLVGISLPPLISSHFGWPFFGLSFSLLVALSYLVTIRSIWNWKIQPAPVQPSGAFKGFLTAFKNRPFVIFASANLLVQTAFLVLMAAIPFYTKYVLKASASETSLLLLTLFSVAFLFTFFWAKVIVKIGTKKTFLFSMFAFIIFLGPLFWLNNLFLVLLMAIFVGANLAGLIITQDVIIAEVIDEDQKLTGSRREGTYFGLHALIIRASIFLDALCLGMVLKISGYNSQALVQVSPVITGIRLLFSFIPITLVAVALAIFFFYPLSLKTKKVDSR